MARVSSQLTIFVCRSIEPALRRVLSLYLIETAPLTFVGRLSSRVREKLWDELCEGFSTHKITMIIPTTTNEQGFVVQHSDMIDDYTTDLDGLTLSIRRLRRREPWETIPAKKNDNFYYPLISHLLDTAAAAKVIWEKVLSTQQRRTITRSLNLTDSVEQEMTAKNLYVLLSGLHDIGKAHPHWQNFTLRLTENETGGISKDLSKDLKPVRLDASDPLRHHEVNSGDYIKHVLKESGFPFKVCLNAELLLASHHGNFKPSTNKETLKERIKKSSWKNQQDSILQMVCSVTGIPLTELKQLEKITQPGMVLYSGLITLADWIVSREEFIQSSASLTHQENLDIQLGYKSLYDNSQILAGDFIKQNHLESPQWKQNIDPETMFGFTPNELQRSLYDHFNQLNAPVEGVTFISAPMGSGKTEAAFLAASVIGKQNQDSGFWVTLPTQSTTDMMFSRAKSIGGKVFDGDNYTVSLMHANASFSNAIEGIRVTGIAEDDKPVSIDDDKEATQLLSAFLKERRLGGMSSISVSTIDQMINSSVPLKHNTLRWLVLSGKTIIIDEVHDFSPYTVELIRRFLEWCGIYRIPVIIMSATLKGEEQRKLIEAYYPESATSSAFNTVNWELGIKSPSWFHAYLDKNNLTIHYEDGLSDPQEKLSYKTELISNGGDFISCATGLVGQHYRQGAMVLAVAHLIDDAIKLYDSVVADIGEENVLLLHSRMPNHVKERKIAELVQRTGKNGKRGKFVLVSTQIVQQSMDIDFDVLVSALPPLPDALQRIGRVYRHSKSSNRAEAYTNKPCVYFIYDEGLVEMLTDEDVEQLKEYNKFAVLPYKLWEILSSYSIFRSLEDQGILKEWDAKSSIHELLGMYVSLQESPNNEVLEIALKEFVNSVVVEQSKGENSVIVPPSKKSAAEAYSIREGQFTSAYTMRSRLAAETRIFQPSVLIVPLWDKGGDWVLDDGVLFNPDEVKMTVDRKKLISQHSISVSMGWFKRNDLESLIIPGESDYVVYINMSISDKIYYNDMKGLTVQ